MQSEKPSLPEQKSIPSLQEGVVTQLGGILYLINLMRYLDLPACFDLIKHRGTVLIPFGPESLQKWGWKMERYIQGTPLREMCIRQFFIARKIQDGSV